MTLPQIDQVRRLLKGVPEDSEFHHGDCIGADAEADNIAGILGLRTFAHPQNDVPNARAFSTVFKEYPAAPLLVRNRQIVELAQVMIAAPRGYLEQFRGSGTWATIRYTRKAKKPLYIIYPDGHVRKENM